MAELFGLSQHLMIVITEIFCLDKGAVLSCVSQWVVVFAHQEMFADVSSPGRHPGNAGEAGTIKGQVTPVTDSCNKAQSIGRQTLEREKSTWATQPQQEQILQLSLLFLPLA